MCNANGVEPACGNRASRLNTHRNDFFRYPFQFLNIHNQFTLSFLFHTTPAGPFHPGEKRPCTDAIQLFTLKEIISKACKCRPVPESALVRSCFHKTHQAFQKQGESLVSAGFLWSGITAVAESLLQKTKSGGENARAVSLRKTISMEVVPCVPKV